jgi:hypothetical protein
MYPECGIIGRRGLVFGLCLGRIVGNIVIANLLVVVLEASAAHSFRQRRGQNGETGVAEKVVTLKLNQQQLELLDRTIAKGVAPDRASLIRLALREYAAKRAAARPEAAR